MYRGYTVDRDALETIAETVRSEDVSPFEMIHSGVIEKLLMYLTSSTELASTSSVSVCVSCSLYNVQITIYQPQLF